MDRILIKNGNTYDPLTKEKKVKDIEIYGGKIVPCSGLTASREIDASGCLVIPGLIDFHVHCLPSASEFALNPDIFCLPNGVTACVDAGTAGAAAFESAYQNTISHSSVTVKALLHFCSAGQITAAYPEDQTPVYWNREKITGLVKKYPDLIKGMKLRFSDHVLKPFKLGIEVLEEGILLAKELALPVVVHVNNPGVDIDSIAKLLRKGDVFCHMYAGSAENILDPSGTVRKSVSAARERGVIFDAASGSRNFMLDVAAKAIKQGFLPDIISTDLTRNTFYKQPVVSFPRFLNMFLAMGLSLHDVIDRATINPALWLGCPELATLKDGSPADIAIFKIIDKETIFYDSTFGSKAGVFVTGKQILIPALTVKNGIVMYSQTDFI